jgi:hypothetical protein
MLTSSTTLKRRSTTHYLIKPDVIKSWLPFTSLILNLVYHSPLYILIPCLPINCYRFLLSRVSFTVIFLSLTKIIFSVHIASCFTQWFQILYKVDYPIRTIVSLPLLAFSMRSDYLIPLQARHSLTRVNLPSS